MTERREIKQRSPAVWAKVKEAYLAGEPAASVARRFDVGTSNLRHRARTEGWTRRDHIEAQDEAEAREAVRLDGAWPPPRDMPPIPTESAPGCEPDQALDQVTRQAAQLLSTGRAAEAQGLIRAAEGLKRLTQRVPRPGEPEPMTIEEEDRLAAEAHAKGAEMINAVIEHLAHELLAQTPTGVPHMYEPFVYAFRARHFGPAIEAADHDHAAAMGWSLRLWDEEGRLKPDVAVGPSGNAPAGTRPPLGDDPGPDVCCAWAEQAKADYPDGPTPDWEDEAPHEA